jgi:hypothetical protein
MAIGISHWAMRTGEGRGTKGGRPEARQFRPPAFDPSYGGARPRAALAARRGSSAGTACMAHRYFQPQRVNVRHGAPVLKIVTHG